ncbi:MAG: ABC transporter ATP-binding protein [candidate division Zixibacteria bacterium]|nr:ABC transporter ATP-binding protein [candidate division Zixibacteria bacterium]
MARITLQNLVKNFGDVAVVKHIDLTVEDGEFFSLLGPSGCGKTTILRMIAGFVFPTSGTIRFDDKDVSFVPPNRRNTGMVFQNYALFPHMTVFENVAFGLRTRRVAPDAVRDRVATVLERVGLGGLEKRPVPQLSGGQQQRVALARAIVIEPALLLLDEPLSNLDAKLREETRDQIRALQQQLRITTLYVTHDQEEALAVSDRIAVLYDGKCQQTDTPDRIYHHPANRFVATFMGRMNLWEGKVTMEHGRAVFRHPRGLSVVLAVPAPEGPVCLGIRPQRLKLISTALDDAVSGHILERRFKGPVVEFRVQAGGVEIQASVASSDPVSGSAPGDAVWLVIPGDETILLSDRPPDSL